MHLYAVVFFHDPLLELMDERPRNLELDSNVKLRHGLVQFFWADDADHAMEQGADASRHETAVPAFCAIVPDDYVSPRPRIAGLVRVSFDWSSEHGPCYDCGRPAAFTSSEHSASPENLRCAVCAANDAAGGGIIRRIEERMSTDERDGLIEQLQATEQHRDSLDRRYAESLARERGLKEQLESMRSKALEAQADVLRLRDRAVKDYRDVKEEHGSHAELSYYDRTAVEHVRWLRGDDDVHYGEASSPTKNPSQRRLRVACAHELDYVYGPTPLERAVCRLFGHRWETCEEHQVRWCDRCQTQQAL